MTTLPTRSAIVSGTTTNAQQKVNLGDLRDFIAELLGTDSSDKAAALAMLGVPITGYKFGLQIVMPTASATMSITAGRAADDTGAYLMSLAAFTKGAGAWVAGSGNGGRLGAAAIANDTWYEWRLIFNPTTGATDVGYDLPGVVTYPSGFTASRKIFSAKTNGSGQWTAVIQRANKFQLVTPVQDVSAVIAVTTAITRTLPSIPPGPGITANLQFVVKNTGTGGNAYAYLSDLDTDDIYPINSFLDNPEAQAGAGGVRYAGGRIDVPANTTQQIRSRVGYADANVSLTINTLGWEDDLGRSA